MTLALERRLRMGLCSNFLRGFVSRTSNTPAKFVRGMVLDSTDVSLVRRATTMSEQAKF